MIIQGVSYLSDFEAKKAIIAAAAKLYQRGWMIAGDGSLSVKVGPDAIWITVAGADKANLTQDQLVRIDINGRQASTNKPKPLGDDIETQLRIYKENERVRSIIHAYPINVIALSSKGKGAEAAAYTPAIRKLGRIALADALKTEQAISDVTLLSKNDNGVILKGDGCMMWGATPQEAADYIELLDYYCEASKSMQGCGEGHCSCKEQKANEPQQAPQFTQQAYQAQAGNIFPNIGLASFPNLGLTSMQNLGLASLMQFIPKCTAECSACANTMCMQRRNTGFIAASAVKQACTGECAKCGNTSCTERRSQTSVIYSAETSGCHESCSSCGNMSCSRRQDTDDSHSGCSGFADAQCEQPAETKPAGFPAPDNCGHDCEMCQYASCQNRQHESTTSGSRVLPSGMTGIIRPGESLPPLPDETKPVVSAAGSANDSAMSNKSSIGAKSLTGTKPPIDTLSSTRTKSSLGVNSLSGSSLSTGTMSQSADRHQPIDKKQLMSGIVKHYIGG